ncbi:Oidioi.mRNA.OKI2018_I69.chr1.g1311.t1.cds [Oikopleura dioica]|uniref:Oidioi.mRNA.OKI2018_I69.chr1.g1311.t1.cds n=1 Tax=Oikopleura dioica TaxID=34765 RepID=A0ABN7SWQ7_OIKDI|nr:Oidioi.mRNA.OKI2018_I69.chr1.g1311.t1.cds [Oikopleura dioica]
MTVDPTEDHDSLPPECETYSNLSFSTVSNYKEDIQIPNKEENKFDFSGLKEDMEKIINDKMAIVDILNHELLEMKSKIKNLEEKSESQSLKIEDLENQLHTAKSNNSQLEDMLFQSAVDYPDQNIGHYLQDDRRLKSGGPRDDMKEDEKDLAEMALIIYLSVKTVERKYHSKPSLKKSTQKVAK